METERKKKAHVTGSLAPGSLVLGKKCKHCENREILRERRSLRLSKSVIKRSEIGKATTR